jgi:hypothetical protein
MFSALLRMWRRQLRSGWASRSPRRPRKGFRPCLEALEDRFVPSTLWKVTSNGDDVNQVGTLRWAVAHAQNGDSIEILPGQNGGLHITLTHGELFLNHDVYIMGGYWGAAIDGGDSSRVFEVAAGANVSFDHLLIEGGNAHAQNPQGNAGLDGLGGGILNEGTLELHQCLVRNNGHNSDGAANRSVLVGGGIFNTNTGNLFLYGGHVDQNFAVEAGGGIFNDAGKFNMALTKMWFNSTMGVGGAIATIEHDRQLTVYVTLTTCDLERNTAGQGGALFNQDCKLWVNDCTLENNQADAGAGIYTLFGFMTVSHTSLYHNTAKHDGGGVYSWGGKVYFSNESSLYNNTAGGVGGGIYDQFGTMDVEHSYLDDNTALAGAAIYNNQGNLRVDLSYLDSNSASFFGGGIANNGGTAWVSGSHLTDNSAPAGAAIFNTLGGTLKIGTTVFSPTPPDNIDGSWIDLGGNKFM